MMKATGTVNGRNTLFIGLSFGNLDKFRTEPGDTYIRISGKEMGLPMDVLIFSGKTEADLADMIPVGPDTKVYISDRLKS